MMLRLQALHIDGLRNLDIDEPLRRAASLGLLIVYWASRYHHGLFLTIQSILKYRHWGSPITTSASSIVQAAFQLAAHSFQFIISFILYRDDHWCMIILEPHDHDYFFFRSSVNSDANIARFQISTRRSPLPHTPQHAPLRQHASPMQVSRRLFVARCYRRHKASRLWLHMIFQAYVSALSHYITTSRAFFRLSLR